MVIEQGRDWSQMMAFYDQARRIFGESASNEETKQFLRRLQESTGASLALIIFNSGKSELKVCSEDRGWSVRTSALIEQLPLLYQSYTCTRVEPESLSALCSGLECTETNCLSDAVYFSLESGESLSLLYLLAKTGQAGRFSAEELLEIDELCNFLGLVCKTSFLANQGEVVSDKLRIQHKRESVWLESLAWLNDMGSIDLDDDMLHDFYKEALFQFKLLLSADFALALNEASDQHLSVQEAFDCGELLGPLQQALQQFIHDKEFNSRARFIYNQKRMPTLAKLGINQILLYPLVVNLNMDILLVAGRRESAFEAHEEMVATLFSDGVKHIVERVALLKKIRRNNDVLQREKDEQATLIKKLSEAQDQLLQQEKMASIGQLAAGVAHEINNPVGYVSSNINSLEGYITNLFSLLSAYEKLEQPGDEGLAPLVESIQTLKKKIDYDFVQDDVHDLIRESKEGVNRVKQIVKDLKDFSHVDEAEWQWADLVSGIESTLNIVHNELKYKAQVVKEFDDLPKVECVPTQLNQVVMNLLVNAGHAIEEKGTIVIRAKKLDEENVYIEVEDSGKGIPEENLSKIFDPFFTTKPVGKGTGLGLSLSYSIIEKHGGELSVSSKVGEGACFRVVLPIRQAEQKAE